jgi:hypothetical protein
MVKWRFTPHRRFIRIKHSMMNTKHNTVLACSKFSLRTSVQGVALGNGEDERDQPLPESS